MASKDIGVDNARVSRLCATVTAIAETLCYQQLRDFGFPSVASRTSAPLDTEASR
jgi:hypothetical protein